MKRFRRGSLYVITDPKVQQGRNHLEVLTEAIRGGASVVQLRDKDATDEALIAMGKRLREVCDRFQALLIVNERVSVAKAIHADGLHIGQDDLSIPEARRQVGKEILLGISTHSLEQAKQAVQEGADYIGVGPIFKTPTKPDAPAVGIGFIKRVRQHLSIPFVAIGGINPSNARDVLAAGADSVAVVRAVVAEADVYQAAKGFSTLLISWKEGLESRHD